MESLLESLPAHSYERLIAFVVANGGIRALVTFLLVAARLAGAVVIAPIGASSDLFPWQFRLGLVFLLSCVITPGMLDLANADPTVVQTSFNASTSSPLPETMADLFSSMVNELGLGSLLGVAVLVILSGLRMGGEWIDRHMGLGFAALMSPARESSNSIGQPVVLLLGTAVLLLSGGSGGGFLVVRMFLDTFREIPLGIPLTTCLTAEHLGRLLQLATGLGLRIAMPIVVVMTSIDMAIAVAMRSSPQSLVAPTMVARIGAGVACVAACLTSIPEIVVRSITTTFRMFVAG
jgi:flagellar biosynthesis protein FliR